MKRSVSFKLLVCFFLVISFMAGAEPSAFVNDPRDLQLIDLAGVAKYLEKDLDLDKGIVDLIGKEVINSKFRQAGIPDPAKESLSYGIVAREGSTENLSLVFILKGNVDQAKFLKFAEKRYQKYFETLKSQNIIDKEKYSCTINIGEKSARLFPFAFRNSEAVVLSFNDYTLIATVPQGDYSILNDTIAVLEGKVQKNSKQPERFAFLAAFSPIPQEREEILNFENRYEGFAARTKKRFSKIINPQKFEDTVSHENLEKNLKSALSKIERFSYEVSSSRKGEGFAYEINLLFKCSEKKQASKLREMFLEWLLNNSEKNVSTQDLASLRKNKVLVQDNTCIYQIRLGSSDEEQWQFSSTLISLMFQDRRFHSIFKG
ncbi:MAG: hypothetical protein HQM10_05445 [Candidatus Riflebacteria bacterium]|nr:hypothetical protein [Candidatus Riflebacteria bacterium]